MLRIKLVPFGRRHLHHFRICLTEDREKLTSDPTEVIGFYEPKLKKVTVDRQKLEKWLKVGAQPSDSIRKLLGL